MTLGPSSELEKTPWSFYGVFSLYLFSLRFSLYLFSLQKKNTSPKDLFFRFFFPTHLSNKNTEIKPSPPRPHHHHRPSSLQTPASPDSSSLFLSPDLALKNPKPFSTYKGTTGVMRTVYSDDGRPLLAG